MTGPLDNASVEILSVAVEVLVSFFLLDDDAKPEKNRVVVECLD